MGVLQKEIETYNAKLPEFLEHEGKFVLIHGAEVLDFFDTYGDAMKAGYKSCGLLPFFVKRVARIEPVIFF